MTLGFIVEVALQPQSKRSRGDQGHDTLHHVFGQRTVLQYPNPWGPGRVQLQAVADPPTRIRRSFELSKLRTGELPQTRSCFIPQFGEAPGPWRGDLELESRMFQPLVAVLWGVLFDPFWVSWTEGPNASSRTESLKDRGFS